MKTEREGRWDLSGVPGCIADLLADTALPPCASSPPSFCWLKMLKSLRGGSTSCWRAPDGTALCSTRQATAEEAQGRWEPTSRIPAENCRNQQREGILPQMCHASVPRHDNSALFVWGTSILFFHDLSVCKISTLFVLIMSKSITNCSVSSPAASPSPSLGPDTLRLWNTFFFLSQKKIKNHQEK